MAVRQRETLAAVGLFALVLSCPVSEPSSAWSTPTTTTDNKQKVCLFFLKCKISDTFPNSSVAWLGHEPQSVLWYVAPQALSRWLEMGEASVL